MKPSVLRSLPGLAAGLSFGLSRTLERLAQERRDRDIEKLKAHLSWHEADAPDRRGAPRGRR